MRDIKNILFDRDGTLIYDRHYLSDPAKVELLPGCMAGLRRMRASGLRLFVVTNQSGIGRGFFTEADYQACANRLNELLAEGGVRLEGSAFCPHDPEAGPCLCRKPGPGMWLELRGRYGLEASETLMVGDKPEDVAFGRNQGLALCALALSGKGEGTAAKLGLASLPPAAGFAEIPGAAGDGLPDLVVRGMDGLADFLRLPEAGGEKS